MQSWQENSLQDSGAHSLWAVVASKSIDIMFVCVYVWCHLRVWFSNFRRPFNLKIMAANHQHQVIAARHGVNSIWSISIPHQIYQFQLYSNSKCINSIPFFLTLFCLIHFTMSKYSEYLLRIPTPSSLYSK